MLKSATCVSNGLGNRHLFRQQKSLTRSLFQSYISTNTAINQSLRRFRKDTKSPERPRAGHLRSHGQNFGLRRRPSDGDRTYGRRVETLDAQRERKPRPKRKQEIDIEAMREPASINENQETQRRLRKQLRRNEQGEFDRSSRGAKYDYTRNPEGNRAFRRALKFGKQAKPERQSFHGSVIRPAAHRKAFKGEDTYMPEKDIFKRTPFNSTTRRAALRYGEEQKHGNSIPEEPQDDMDMSTEPQRPRFSMERQFDRHDRAPYGSGSIRKDYEAPSRPNSHALVGYDRESPRSDEEQWPSQAMNVPLSIPYTTSASEFLYGTSVIIAALLSSRRKLYKLYIYSGGNREVGEQDQKVRDLALKRGVVAERVQGDWLRLMDRMSAGRPHNGYILEASPIPKPPVTGLHAVQKQNGIFHVVLGHQSREDEAVNGTGTTIKYNVAFPRYPFVLLLDGILDPGNLGAILRSAFFLGVDAVVISNRSSAPVSPVAIKASAGASETLPLLSVSQPGDFIDQCKSNGWKVYAAVAPTPGRRTGLGNYFSTSDLGSPVRSHPCLLVLGGEGEGLRWNIQRKADIDVGIDGPRLGQSQVDSLNVSVAAGLLCEAFLRKPAGQRNIDMDEKIQVENRVF